MHGFFFLLYSGSNAVELNTGGASHCEVEHLGKFCIMVFLFRGRPFIIYASGGGRVDTPYTFPISVMLKKCVQGGERGSDLA